MFVMKIENMTIHAFQIASSDVEGEKFGHLLAL
jgi:hypothetical protein